ncbi:MAG: dTMP kinase [Planctomycetota bacterium]|jgi:dTMP kinase
MSSTDRNGAGAAGPEGAQPLFVVIDGVDGCGKSTQAQLLVELLSGAAHLREPGSTDLGERIRSLLLDRSLHMGAEVETLLFAAARRQMLDELVRPALAAGRDVVCERFHPSTFAYQAVAGDLEEGAVLGLLHGWASEPMPDLIVLLEVPVDAASRRRGAATDRIEDKGTAYQERVAEGYRIYAKRDPRTVVIDGTRTPNQVATQVAEAVEEARKRVALEAGAKPCK